MEWRMKSFGIQKHLIWFWHFGAYVSLVSSGKTSRLYLQPSPLFILFLPYLHLLSSFFLCFFTIFFCLYICLSVCLSAAPCVLFPGITVKVLLPPNDVVCCFSSWLSCLQVLETVNVLAWFYVHHCWRLAQCIRDYTFYSCLFYCFQWLILREKICWHTLKILLSLLRLARSRELC